MEPRPEPSPQPTFRQWICVHVQRVAIFFVWYVLGIGPLFWEWHHAQYSRQFSLVEFVYRPLVYLCEIPWVRVAVNAYIDLWIL